MIKIVLVAISLVAIAVAGPHVFPHFAQYKYDAYNIARTTKVFSRWIDAANGRYKNVQLLSSKNETLYIFVFMQQVGTKQKKNTHSFFA